ncbi:MAG: phytanoyl-CoA dioxygenase family protein [Gemmataceae bacterium]|nr:phytanoyl-CoA dioxygenase family protein [Gemmataceae bacterium]
MNIARALAESGFAFPVRVLAPDTAAGYAARLVRFLDRHSADPDFKNWTYVKAHLALGWVAQLARETAILDAAEAALGPDLVLWDSFIPAKPPRSAGYFGWHQDGTYWSVGPLDEIVTLWVALGAVNEANGAMKMIPGSHLRGQLDHEKTFDKESLLRRGQRVRDALDESAAVAVRLAPGEASLHRAFTVHGSGPNPSDDWRLGVSLVYVSGRVGAKAGHAESGVRMRGETLAGGLDAETPATDDLGDSERAEYRRVTQRSATRYADAPKRGGG